MILSHALIFPSYMKYVREAQSSQYRQAMNELDALKFLYHAGRDMLDRDIIVFAEAMTTGPLTRYGHQTLLRYIISKIDPYANAKFILVYAHGGMDSTVWEIWKELMVVAQLKYEKTLATFCVLHPTLAFKAGFQVGEGRGMGGKGMGGGSWGTTRRGGTAKGMHDSRVVSVPAFREKWGGLDGMGMSMRVGVTAKVSVGEALSEFEEGATV